MNLKNLVIAGFSTMLGLGLVFIAIYKAKSQSSPSEVLCGVQDSRAYRFPPYYYDPEQHLGCSPAAPGGWHRYYGTVNTFGGIWGIPGKGVLFRGGYAYSQVRPAGVIDVTPVRVRISRH